MILGMIVMACGSHLICQNEDIWLLLSHGLEQVMATPLELPCRLNATLRAPMVHLKGCSVSGARFSAATRGLEELRLFPGCLPDEGVLGAWFKVNLERYDEKQHEWLPVKQAANLKTTHQVGEGVRIGGFNASPGVAHMVPGSSIRLQACNGSAADPDAELSARTMRPRGHALYSGDPVYLNDGDVRVTFLVGDADEVSLLSAVSAGLLHLWHPPLHGLHALTALPKLGIVEAGDVSAEVLQRRLAPETQVSFWHLWPLRSLGFLLIWIGMSLMLFPNHVYPDFCGKCCMGRSIPGALVTTLASGGASWCYFHAFAATTISVVVLVPVLLALAAGVDVRGQFRRAKDSLRRVSQGSDEHGIPYHVLEATGAAASALSRGTRAGAFGVGMGLVVAGPAVQSFALISVLGDMWDGLQQ